VDAALDLLDDTNDLDGAVVDLNLQGEMAYPVADALRERQIPFVFSTGYDQSAIPPRYGDTPRCEKPAKTSAIAQALFG
jgi:CheY-like chemotaxis protein